MSILSNAFPNGLGESTGDSLVTVEPWYTESSVYYVSSVLGNDSNSGLERLLPKATLTSAFTVIGSNDIIVLASDHDETFTSPQTMPFAGVVIVGAGSSSGAPTATLRINSATASLLVIAKADVQIRNILFPTAVQSNTGAKILLGSGETAASGTLVKGCKFECAGNDQGQGISNTNNDDCWFEDCTFVVTEATGGTPPAVGMISTDVLSGHMVITDCTFDGGTVGFASGYGLDMVAAAVSKLRIEGVSLLNGADMIMAEASGGRINVSTSTGSARVVFD